MWYYDNYKNVYHICKDTLIIKGDGSLYQETYRKGEILIQVNYTHTHRMLKLLEKVRKQTFKEYNADIDQYHMESILLPASVYYEWKKDLI